MYKVNITDNKTNETRTVDMDLEWGDHLWWWTEGNFGCDCNRNDVFNYGKEHADYEDIDCGKTRYTVDFVELSSGKRISIDSHNSWDDF